MINHSQNSAGKVLLTNLEREYLKGKKPMDPKIKSRLVNKLDKRFLELFKDLEIIKKSKFLVVWRATRVEPRGYFSKAEIILLNQVFSGVSKVHLSVIQTEKKGKKYVYWLDHRPHNYAIIRNDDRSLKPEYVLRGLSSRVKEEYGKELVEAYEAEKITDKPKTLEQLRKLIRH